MHTAPCSARAQTLPHAGRARSEAAAAAGAGLQRRPQHPAGASACSQAVLGLVSCSGRHLPSLCAFTGPDVRTCRGGGQDREKPAAEPEETAEERAANREAASAEAVAAQARLQQQRAAQQRQTLREERAEAGERAGKGGKNAKNMSFQQRVRWLSMEHA